VYRRHGFSYLWRVAVYLFLRTLQPQLPSDPTLGGAVGLAVSVAPSSSLLCLMSQPRQFSGWCVKKTELHMVLF
jgi:hypothetical protein